jgi:protoheme IX farnesyltransferase
VTSRISQKILPFLELIKYKLSLAVTFSSVTGYFICRNNFDKSLAFLISGVFLLSAGSAALNQYTEKEYDAVMERTKSRPIPLLKIHSCTALRMAVLLMLSGLFFLILNGLVPAFLGALNIFLYNYVYTRLKRITTFSIIPGAFVGAIPPLIGYYSAGPITFQTEIILFSSFMFLWQLPHFWLIIIKYGEEYKKAGFSTINLFLNEKQIRYLIFFWVLFSTIFLLIFSQLGFGLNNYLNVILIPLNLIFILFFYRLLFLKNSKENIGLAFVLINSFSLILMFFFIADSFLK